MVKKKRKRAGKKVVSIKKTNYIKKTPSQVKKDFQVYAQGVERLKELERELKSFDTRGFSKEEQSIKQKLKNVSDIPIIERELKQLKSKISGKYKPKRKKTSKLKRDLDEIKDYADDLPQIKREIKKLGERKDYAEDLPEIKDEIKKLGTSIETIKRLSKKKKKEKLKIDTGVGTLVDTDFNDFLNTLKVNLSNRITKREEQMDQILNSDLEKREQKFKQRNEFLIREFGLRKRKLEEDFNKKYNQKLKSTLDKEIAEKFNAKLQEKLEKEKVELGKSYKMQLREHAENELKNKEDSLRKRYADLIKQKTESLINEEKIFLNKENNLKENLINKEHELKNKEDSLRKRYADLIKQNSKILNNKEKSLKENLNNKEKSLKENLSNREKNFLENLQKHKEKTERELENKFREKLQSELNRKEKIIKEQLKNEFEAKLKKQIQEHELEIKKEKADLELMMQRKIKEVLK